LPKKIKTMMRYKESEEFEEYEDAKSVTDEVDPWTATSVIALLAFVVIILGLVIFNNDSSDPRTKTHITDTTKDTAAVSQDPFNDIVLEAKAVFVYDVLRQEVLYARNEETQLPLASLTKLMTVLVAQEILPEGATITITQESLALDGDSGLLRGERWHLEDLLGLTLLGSSNDGASAVASVAGSFKSSFPGEWLKNKETFVHLMNEKAKKIGLTQTYFINETGLDAGEYAGGGYGSAKDIVRLLEYSIEHVRSIIDVTRYATLEFLSLNNINHIDLILKKSYTGVRREYRCKDTSSKSVNTINNASSIECKRHQHKKWNKQPTNSNVPKKRQPECCNF